MSQLKIVLIMTNCARFIQCSTWYETALLSAASLEKNTAFKGRLSYVQYLLGKPIKRGIKVLICCDTGQQQSSLTLALEMILMMKLCKEIPRKNHYL